MTRLHQLCGPDLYARVVARAERDNVAPAEWARRALYRVCEDRTLEALLAKARIEALKRRREQDWTPTDGVTVHMLPFGCTHGKGGAGPYLIGEGGLYVPPDYEYEPVLAVLDTAATDRTPLAQSLAAMRGRLTLDRVHGGGR